MWKLLTINHRSWMRGRRRRKKSPYALVLQLRPFSTQFESWSICLTTLSPGCRPIWTWSTSEEMINLMSVGRTFSRCGMFQDVGYLQVYTSFFFAFRMFHESFFWDVFGFQTLPWRTLEGGRLHAFHHRVLTGGSKIQLCLAFLLVPCLVVVQQVGRWTQQTNRRIAWTACWTRSEVRCWSWNWVPWVLSIPGFLLAKEGDLWLLIIELCRLS